MDNSITRKPSLLADLRWDPVSGSCVLKSSLRTPNADTSPHSVPTDAEPSTYHHQRRASAPLPSGANTTDEAQLRSSSDCSGIEDKTSLETKTKQNHPISKSLVTEEKILVPSKVSEKCGTTLYEQRSHQRDLTDFSRSPTPQPSSSKAFFGVILRPASFSGTPSHRSAKTKTETVSSPPAMPSTTQRFSGDNGDQTTTSHNSSLLSGDLTTAVQATLVENTAFENQCHEKHNGVRDEKGNAQVTVHHAAVTKHIGHHHHHHHRLLQQQYQEKQHEEQPHSQNHPENTTNENNDKKPGYLRRDESLPYDQSVLKKRGSLPLKSGVPSFFEAKQMFAAGNHADNSGSARKSSVSDTQTIKVNVRDLVRRMSDSCPGSDRPTVLPSSSGLNVDLPKAGLEPLTPWSESRASTTRPQRHTSCMKPKISSATQNIKQLQDNVLVHGHSTSELPSLTQQSALERSDTKGCPRWRQGIEVPNTSADSKKRHSYCATKAALQTSDTLETKMCFQTLNGTVTYWVTKEDRNVGFYASDEAKEKEVEVILGRHGVDDTSCGELTALGVTSSPVQQKISCEDNSDGQDQSVEVLTARDRQDSKPITVIDMTSSGYEIKSTESYNSERDFSCLSKQYENQTGVEANNSAQEVHSPSVGQDMSSSEEVRGIFEVEQKDCLPIVELGRPSTTEELSQSLTLTDPNGSFISANPKKEISSPEVIKTSRITEPNHLDTITAQCEGVATTVANYQNATHYQNKAIATVESNKETSKTVPSEAIPTTAATITIKPDDENTRKSESNQPASTMTSQGRQESQGRKSLVAGLISKFSTGTPISDPKQETEARHRQHNHRHRLSLPTPSLDSAPKGYAPSQRSKAKLGRSNSLRGPMNATEGQGHDQESMYIDQAEIERLLLKSQELRRSKQTQQADRQSNLEREKAATSSTAGVTVIELDGITTGSIASVEISPNYKNLAHDLTAKSPDSRSTLSSSEIVEFKLSSGRDIIPQLETRSDQNPPRKDDDPLTNVSCDKKSSDPETVDQKSNRIEYLMQAYSKGNKSRRTTISAVPSAGEPNNTQGGTKIKPAATLFNDTNGDLLQAAAATATTGLSTKPPPVPALRKHKAHNEHATTTTTTKHGTPTMPSQGCGDSVSNHAKDKPRNQSSNLLTEMDKSKTVGDANTNGSKNEYYLNASAVPKSDNACVLPSKHLEQKERIQGQGKDSVLLATMNDNPSKEIHSSDSVPVTSSKLLSEHGENYAEDYSDENVFTDDDDFLSCIGNTETSELDAELSDGTRQIDGGKSSQLVTITTDTVKPARETIRDDKQSNKEEAHRSSQAERIARYKEDRRRQLAYVSEKVGLELSAAPGLNFSSTTSTARQQRRSSSSSSNVTDSKHCTENAPFKVGRRFVDQDHDMSKDPSPISSPNKTTAYPLGEDLEHKSDNQFESKFTQGDKVITNQVSPRSKKSTSSKHDCVFKRLTSASKTSPRCRKMESEKILQEKATSEVNNSKKRSGSHVPSQDKTSVDSAGRPKVVRSSLAAAKKWEQACQGISSGLGPKEIYEISHGISNLQQDKWNLKACPKDKGKKFSNSPRGNIESNSPLPKYAFGSTISSPSSSPRISKPVLSKNYSKDCMAKKIKHSPRVTNYSSESSPNSQSPRSQKPWNTNTSTMTPDLSEFVGEPLHGKTDSSVNVYFKGQPCVSTTNDNIQASSLSHPLDNRHSQLRAKQRKDANKDTILMSGDKKAIDHKHRPASMRDRRPLPNADKIGLIRRESAPASSSSSLETNHSQRVSPSAGPMKKQMSSDLSYDIGQKKAPTGSVFCKEYALGMSKNKSERVSTQIQSNKEEKSFTRQHLSKSRRLSWGFGVRLPSDADRKVGHAKLEGSRADKVSQELYGKPSGAAEKKSEPRFLVREPEAYQDVELNKGSRLHEKRHFSSKFQNFSITNRRKTLPAFKPTSKAPVELTSLEAPRSLKKRASLGNDSECMNPTSRAERLQNLRREQNEALAQFKKFIRREGRPGVTTELTHVTEEQVSHEQECCIRVSSMKEAESLAKALVESVRQGKHPEVCLQQITKAHTGRVLHQIVMKEPEGQSSQNLTGTTNTGNFDLSDTLPEKGSDVYYDALDADVCSDASSPSCKKSFPSCVSESEASQGEVRPFPFETSGAVTRCPNTKTFKRHSMNYKSAPLQTVNLKETGNGRGDKISTPDNNNISPEEINRKIAAKEGINQDATSTKEVEDLVSSVSLCPSDYLSAYKEATRNEKSASKNCPSLTTFSNEDIAFKTAETSHLESSELSSPTTEDSGYHVVQALSPRAVVPVMIVPGQEINTAPEPSSTQGVPHIQVSSEGRELHQHTYEGIDQKEKENKHDSLKPPRNNSVGGKKNTSSLKEEQYSTTIKVTDHSAKSNPLPITNHSSDGAENEVRIKESVAASTTTVAASSTMTISSETTVYSGPYPASTTLRLTKAKSHCVAENEKTSSFKSMCTDPSQSEERTPLMNPGSVIKSDTCKNLGEDSYRVSHELFVKDDKSKQEIWSDDEKTIPDSAPEIMLTALQRESSNHTNYDHKTSYQRQASDLDGKRDAHESQGLLCVTGIEIETSDAEGTERDRGRAVISISQPSGMLDTENTELLETHVNTEYHTIPLAGDVSWKSSTGSTTADIERELKIEASQTKCTDPLFLSTQKTETNMVKPRGYEGVLEKHQPNQTTDLLAQTHPVKPQGYEGVLERDQPNQIKDIIEQNPQSTVDGTANVQNLNDALFKHRGPDINSSHQMKLFSAGDPEDASYLTYKNASVGASQNSKWFVGSSKGTVTKDISLNSFTSENGLVEVDSEDNLKNNKLSCNSHACVSFEKLDNTGKVYESTTPISANRTTQPQMPERKSPSTEPTAKRSSTFIIKESDSRQHIGRDLHWERKNARQPLVKDQTTGDQRVNEMGCHSASNESHSPKMRHTACQTVHYTSKDAGTDLPFQQRKTEAKDTCSDDSSKNLSSNQSVQAYVQCIEKGLHAEGVEGMSNIQGNNTTIAMSSTKDNTEKIPKQSEKSQPRTATFVIQHLCDELDTSKSLEISTASETQTHNNKQLEPSFCGERNISDCETVLNHKSHVIDTNESLNQTSSYHLIDACQYPKQTICEEGSVGSVRVLKAPATSQLGFSSETVVKCHAILKEEELSQGPITHFGGLESSLADNSQRKDIFGANSMLHKSQHEEIFRSSRKNAESSHQSVKRPNSAKQTQSQLDLDYLIKNLDLSSDSFDSLFLQNAMYLKGEAAAATTTAATHASKTSTVTCGSRSVSHNTHLILRRRRSASGARFGVASRQGQSSLTRKNSALETPGAGATCWTEELVPSPRKVRR
ncbi:hypothetical protein ElyMa_004152800 [Elysia marginata]|uniref:Uncharacterized protein n=1 Tax=Elysia marginata TaxID=1093978 RepID=A0AAV4GHG8_9GAST|nr:hypothetical protein ElyMa_004152800 [Elysia marginata]